MRHGGAPPKGSPSTAARLPQEVVEMIIVHLIYDKYDLIACSLTCYSWYIAAVPHLHHTLIVLTTSLMGVREKFMWPIPLLHMHNLGLLPLVKRLRICKGCVPDHNPFPPARFNYFIRHRLSAFTNIQELEVDRLDIPRFIPRLRRYFGHFIPTLRSLALREPAGCYRQVLYFIGLFQHLENLKLLFQPNRGFLKPTNHRTLVPLFTPPLRGRLTMTSVKTTAFSKHMIDLFGGIRFRHVDLYKVNGIQLLLDACAETLETLRLYPIDSSGKQLPPRGAQVPTNGFTGNSSLCDFDLSRHKSLRTLEILAQFITSTSNLLKHVLSTIASPAFLEVVVIYQDRDFRGVRTAWASYKWGPFQVMSQSERAKEASRHHERFNALREVYKVREFQLLLCADVWERVGDYSMRTLKAAVAVEKANGVFGDFSSEPIVIHTPRVIPVWVEEELHAAGPPIPWTSLRRLDGKSKAMRP